MAKIIKKTEGVVPRKRIKKGGEDPAIKLWRNRLSNAEKRLKKHGGDPKDGGAGFKELIAFYEGDQWSGVKNKGRWHRITSNIVKANIDSLRPQLYFQNPRVHITLKNPYILPADLPKMTIDPATQSPVPQMNPQTGQPEMRFFKGTPVAKVGGDWVDASQQKRLIEAVDNYYVGEMRTKHIVKKCISDSLILPYGVAKLEWIVEENPILDEDTGLEITETKEYPKLTRIKPWRFLWDDELDEFDLPSARWVAEVCYLTKEEIQNNPLLENTSDTYLPDSKHINESVADDYEESDEIPESEKRYKVYEIHDLEHDKLIYWLEGSKKFQFHGANFYSAVEGSIFTVLGHDETPNDSFPLARIEQMKTKQQAYNYLISAMLNHVQRFNRKYGIQKDTMTPDNKRKLEEGADGTIVEYEGLKPEPIQDAAISFDLYRLKDILKKEITEESGVTAMQRGSREPGVETAFEADTIQGGADVKTQELRDNVKDFVDAIVRKLNQVLKTYVDAEQAIQVAGPEGTSWLSWTKDDIQGEFVESVDIYTAMAGSETVDKKQGMEMFSLIQQDPMFDQYEVRSTLLELMKWPSTLLPDPNQARQQAKNAEAMEELSKNVKNQSTTIRPTEGEVKRAPDMMAAIMGGAARGE